MRSRLNPLVAACDLIGELDLEKPNLLGEVFAHLAGLLLLVAIEGDLVRQRVDRREEFTDLVGCQSICSPEQSVIFESEDDLLCFSCNIIRLRQFFDRLSHLIPLPSLGCCI